MKIFDAELNYSYGEDWMLKFKRSELLIVHYICLNFVEKSSSDFINRRKNKYSKS